ncbi:hypothetical protein J8J14_05365 [Roseomonas sp. SSH11]|uniref:Uncharacterized protein n=1 Tax=Pararoseomonas baculiformis TaxID=2820812 RepID=A0ABS4AB17_9PROT|nr:hypothetical protein [Pararoseomonas baculiformis]MBP0444201.1 hypothetical protein [Pararoseomonas baculiformis]
MSTPAPARWIALRLLGVAGLLALAGLLLLGLPGAFWLALASPLAGLLTSQQAPPDSAWPMAILVALIWPWGLPLAYLAALPLARGWRRGLATLAGMAGMALLLAAGMQVAFGRL